MKGIIFWDIKVNRRFVGTYRLHLQGRKQAEQETSVKSYGKRLNYVNSKVNVRIYIIEFKSFMNTSIQNSAKVINIKSPTKQKHVLNQPFLKFKENQLDVEYFGKSLSDLSPCSIQFFLRGHYRTSALLVKR
jgi:hypothetical protein